MRLLAVAPLLVACTDPPLPDSVVSCQGIGLTQQSPVAPALDLVFVVSDAASLATYRDRVIAQLTELGGIVEDQYVVSIQVTFVGRDGLGLGCPTFEPAFTQDLDQPWWSCVDDPAACRNANFDAGQLDDLLGCAAAALPMDADGPAPLLERVTEALETDTAFGRRSAGLGLVVIAAEDDASPDPVASYVDRLLALRDRPELAWVSTITRAPSPRLVELRERIFVDGWSNPVDLDAAEWWPVIVGTIAQTDAALRCLEERPVDIDPDEPGLQGDCVVAEAQWGEYFGHEVIPPCPMLDVRLPAPDVLPCYWIDPEVEAFDGTCAVPMIERQNWKYGAYPIIRCACEPG